MHMEQYSSKANSGEPKQASKIRRIAWISFLVMDKDLHKTTQLEVLRSLAKRGHHVSLFATYSKKKFESGASDVKIIALPLRYISSLAAVVYTIFLSIFLMFYCVYSNPDFLIVEPREPTYFSVLPLCLFPKVARPKILLDIRSTPISGAFMENWLFTTAVKISKKLFDGITIITPMMKKEICDDFDLLPDKVGIWTSGVSPTIFDSTNISEKPLREILGLQSKFVVFYHGSLGMTIFQGKARGITETIKSLRIIEKECPDLVLFLLGNKESFSWIKKFCKGIGGLENRVILHEQVDYNDVPKYIAVSDMAIVPLQDIWIWRNQSPLKLLEYLSMKKVVLATDIPANRYVMGNSECGVYLQTAKPKEIAQGISYLYNNRSSLARWGESGRAIVSERYSWAKVAQDLEEYLLRIE
jgi:glycosyltransferase involved in cell wall biosynthesis